MHMGIPQRARKYQYELNTDTDSDAELDYKARKYALRTWRCHRAPADLHVPPGLVQNPTTDMTRSNMDNDENPEKCEHEEWINRNLHSPWICANHQHGWENSDMQIYDIMYIAEWYPNTMDCLQPEEGNCLPHAVCYDSVALMPLIQTNRVLFSNGGDTADRSGHDSDDGGSPAGLLGYLSWCLY